MSKHYDPGHVDFYNEILVPLFPQLKEIRRIRRLLLDVEADKPITLTVELLPRPSLPDEAQPIMKHYELVEKPLDVFLNPTSSIKYEGRIKGQDVQEMIDRIARPGKYQPEEEKG